MIPKPLLEVAEYLKVSPVFLTKSAYDSRADSGESEGHVIQALQNARRWDVYSPNIGQKNNRAWYDVKIDGYYCNIKISACGSNDNTNAKKAIYYFLTGNENVESVPNQDEKFFQMMKENEREDETRDYYYLIVNKNNTNDIFFVSLKGITNCIPAPNNLPFQVNWGCARESEQRTWKEARQYLLGMWAESIERLISLRNEGMPASYPEFFL